VRNKAVKPPHSKSSLIEPSLLQSFLRQQIFQMRLIGRQLIFQRPDFVNGRGYLFEVSRTWGQARWCEAGRLLPTVDRLLTDFDFAVFAADTNASKVPLIN
jgi:hypothetical protein